MNDAAEAIARVRVRDTLAGTEQRQSQALTAAEVERNRTELFERQRVRGCAGNAAFSGRSGAGAGGN